MKVLGIFGGVLALSGVVVLVVLAWLEGPAQGAFASVVAGILMAGAAGASGAFD